MFCDQCGSENPTQNKFCGQCGAKLAATNGRISDPLSAPPGPVSSEFRREVEQQQLRLQRLATSSSVAPDPVPVVDPGAETAVEERTYTGGDSARACTADNEAPISGPSFLGLSGPAPDRAQDLSYLYEDESRPGRARKILAFLVAVGFLALIAYEWRQNPDWQTALMGRRAKQTVSANGNSQSPSQNVAPDQGTGPGNAASGSKAEQNPSDSTGGPSANSQPASASSQQPSAAPGQSTSAKPGSSSRPGPDNSGRPDQSATAAPSHDAGSGAPSEVETNSTGAVGEPQAADNGDLVAGKTSPQERTAVAKKGVNRSTAAMRPAKAEEPDNDLVAKADAYLYGRGVRRNCQQALVLLRTAANRGNSIARSKLGGLYATGQCVPLDRAEAYNWFTLSRDAGNNNVWVERSREMLWSKMTPDERSRVIEPPR